VLVERKAGMVGWPSPISTKIVAHMRFIVMAGAGRIGVKMTGSVPCRGGGKKEIQNADASR
jgi:hypothetical protein